MTLFLSDRSVDLDTGRLSTGGQLRAMELRVLRHLVHRSGDVVSTLELLTSVWGYKPHTRTSTVHTTLYRLRTAIEVDPRHPRHLVTVDGAGVTLAGADLVDPTRPSLPHPRDAWFGRGAELAAIPHQPGLVTLVGPSGVGKTRLAIEWARSRADWFPGGRWFVDAAGARGADELADRVGRTLRLDPRALVDGVGAALHLLVLDDLQPDPTLADTLGRWLDAGPMTLLVTGHQPLGVRSERLVRVGPLALPVGSEHLDDAPASALLIDRIRCRSHTFDPAAHRAELFELARATEGFPLVLEIVAGLAATLGPSVALADLRRRSGSGPIEAMLESTWSRLPPWGRRALRQLATARTFGPAFAAEVLALPAGAPSPAEVLSELVLRGLAVAGPGGRVRLFELVRDWVLRRGADPAARARRDAWFARQARVVRVDGTGRDLPVIEPGELQDWVDVAHAAFDDPGEDASAVAVYTYVLAALADQHTAAEDLAARLEHRPLPPICRAWFLAHRAQWLMHRHRTAESRGYAQRALRELPSLGAPMMTARAGFALTVVFHNHGCRAEAAAAYACAVASVGLARPTRRAAQWLELYQRSADYVFQRGDPRSIATTERQVQLSDELGLDSTRFLGNHALALFDRERIDEAEAVSRRALQVARSAADRAQVAILLAKIANFSDRPAEGLEILDRALSEQARPEPMYAWAVLVRGHALAQLERIDEAEVEAAGLALGPFGRTPVMRLAIELLRAVIGLRSESGAAIPRLESVVAEAEHDGLETLRTVGRTLLAEWFAVLGDPERGLDALATHGADPLREPRVVLVRSEILRRLGRVVEALEVLVALERQPSPPPWVPYAVHSARSDLGEGVRPPGAPLRHHPWTRLYVARTLARSRPTEALGVLDGLVGSEGGLIRDEAGALRRQLTRR